MNNIFDYTLWSSTPEKKTHCRLLQDVLTHDIGHSGDKCASFNTLQLTTQALDDFQELVLPRVNSLPCETLQGYVHMAFNQAIFHNNSAGAIKAAEMRLYQVEEWSRVISLELAAWKAVCQMNAPEKAMANMFAALMWMKEGWKTVKKDHENSKEIHLIMEKVMPFLRVATVGKSSKKIKAAPISTHHHQRPTKSTKRQRCE